MLKLTAFHRLRKLSYVLYPVLGVLLWFLGSEKLLVLAETDAEIKATVTALRKLPEKEQDRLRRRVFQSQFSLEDQKEGMAAYVEKRKPTFRGR